MSPGSVISDGYGDEPLSPMSPLTPLPVSTSTTSPVTPPSPLAPTSPPTSPPPLVDPKNLFAPTGNDSAATTDTRDDAAEVARLRKMVVATKKRAEKYKAERDAHKQSAGVLEKRCLRYRQERKELEKKVKELEEKLNKWVHISEEEKSSEGNGTAAEGMEEGGGGGGAAGGGDE